MKLASGTILAIAALLMSAGVARAADGVAVLTPSLDFGRAVVGATTTKDIELYNGTSSTLQLTSMLLAGDIVDFVPSFTNGTTCPTPSAGASAGVAPGATCVVAVTYAPSTFGPMSGWLNMDFCTAGVTPCEPITTSEVSLTGKGVHAETLTLDPTPVNFVSTALGTSSPTQTVTLTNGPEKMSITGLSLGGSAPDDFVIGHDGCTRTDLAPGASCSFDVSFAPVQTGTRSATVTVAGGTVGNTYPTLALSGVAAGSPVNPAGLTDQGDPGTPNAPTALGGGTDPAHRTEPARPAVNIELVTCKPSHHKSRLQQCTAKLVSGVRTFTATATTARATISRGRVVYATGQATAVGAGRWELEIHKRRALRPGLYTLTLRTRHGVRRVSLRVS
jgi:hypothetical protein